MALIIQFADSLWLASTLLCTDYRMRVCFPPLIWTLSLLKCLPLPACMVVWIVELAGFLLSWIRNDLKAFCTSQYSISLTFHLMKWHVCAHTCILTHLYICLPFVKSATHSCFSNRLTSINLQHSQGESCRFMSSERICFMSASYWIWISFIILFLILKVTLAFLLISSWYAGPIALASLLLLPGRSKLGYWGSRRGKCTLHLMP